LNTPLKLTNAQARLLFLNRQELCRPPTPKLTHDDLLELIRALGFVQVDSINTVARAHHMILFARNQTYQPQQLKRLLETERSLFEHWTHDAAIIPTDFYVYWKHRFVREEESLLNRWRTWRREGFEDALATVFEKVKRDGPTRTRDIQTKREKKGDGWWDWKPEKTALEYHWRTGNFAISGRDGFQKIYDHTENVIPAIHRDANVQVKTFVDWACQSALARLGVATSGEIAAFWALVTPKESAQWVREQIAEKKLIEVVVESADGTPARKAVATSSLAEELGALAPPQKRLRVLSPFDPLIRDRKRCLRLFGFDYRIEVFVPEAKRQYGYYVFPLLEAANLIGRIDMKGNKDTLEVKKIWLEPGVKLGLNRERALNAELERYRRFIGAKSIVYAPDFTV